MSEAMPLTEKSLISVTVSEKELLGIENYKCDGCGKAASQRFKERVGMVKPVDFLVSGKGSRKTSDGGFVYTAAIESPGAVGLRVHFTDVNLPGNAALYVYNMDGEAFGPYTKNGEFWSNTVTGQIAYVQLHHFGPASVSEKEAASFKIAGVGYLGQKFLVPFYQQKKVLEGIARTESLCSYNEPCVEDASCYSGTAVADAKKAAGHMLFASGGWLYICSGGLIADTDSSTQRDMFLTANHCISKGREAGSLEVYFQYWTANCGGSCYDPIGTCPRTVGSSILDSSRDGDHTLLELSQSAPSGSVFLGWNNQPVANNDGTQLFRISYPSGAPQAYSKHSVETTLVECTSLPIGEFIYSEDLIGATEGGSSGSPVMNMNGQIVGQLYGACGYTLEVCDSEENRTVDGALAFYFPQVEEFLDPEGGGGPGGSEMHVDSITLSKKQKGSKGDAIAKVVIVDENGAPVEGADISGTFSGDVSGSGSGTTGADGEATIKLTYQGTPSSFTFCVDNVTHASLTYNAAANVETCDTL